MLQFPSITARSILDVILVGLAAFGHPKAAPGPDVPDKIKAPAGEVVVLRAQASGSQSYVCRRSREETSAWILKSLKAELRDQHGAILGHHHAGFNWRFYDGSEVTGKPIALADSPDPDSIPWLLFTVVGHSGDGVSAHVVTIQRVHTRGGQPPPATDCNASRLNTEIESPYTADYYFYMPLKQSDWPD